MAKATIEELVIQGKWVKYIVEKQALDKPELNMFYFVHAIEN